MNNVKSVMDNHCKHLKLDASFAKEVHKYTHGWLNKNEDHIQFFGGNLLGVHTIRFTSSDRNGWLDELLGIDEGDVRRDVVSLPSIDENWKRGTDVVNLSCVYLVHRVYNSTLPIKVKEQLMVDLLLIMQFKLFSSLMAHFFRYPADEAVALATYAALSKKYAIKQAGNWYNVLLERAKDVISSASIHHQTIVKFNDDAAIMYMITDIQGRLRSIVKNLWVVFDKVRTQDAKIMQVGGMVNLDGKMVVRDVARNFTPYMRYLREIIQDANTFIKPELIEIIASAQHTMPAELLNQALLYMSDAAKSSNKDVDDLLNETMLHAFAYLSKDRRAQEAMGDLGSLIAKLRALYMASRSSDPALLKMRTLGERILKKAVKSKSSSTLAAVRTGLFLYIVLRTFAKGHYS